MSAPSTTATPNSAVPPKRAVDAHMFMASLVRSRTADCAVEDREGETGRVEVPSQHNKVVIARCKGCEFTVVQPSIKVLIQFCEDTTIRITDKIMTASIDLISCRNVRVEVSTNVQTCQVDNCEGSHVTFAAAAMFGNLTWATCEDLTVAVSDLSQSVLTGMRHMNVIPDEDRITQFQVAVIDGKLDSEPIVRLPNGFPTTQRQLDEFNRREADNLRRLQSFQAQITALAEQEALRRKAEAENSSTAETPSSDKTATDQTKE